MPEELIIPVYLLTIVLGGFLIVETVKSIFAKKGK
jgi:hypothetical protein